MKKVFAFLLAVIVLLPALYLNTYATTTSERDEILKKACDLFPEYANSIRKQGTTPYHLVPNTRGREKIFEETRYYSENEAITYSAFSDGSAFISDSTFQKTISQTDSEIISPYVIHYTCDLVVYSTYDDSEKLSVSGIEFEIDSISYDHIIERGEIASDSVSHSGINNNWREWETNTSDAYVSYYADLPISASPPIDCTILFFVGNDKCYVWVNGEVT